MGSLPLAVPASSTTRPATSPRTTKVLLVREPVVPPEPADGLTFLAQECQARMLGDGVPQSLQLPVNSLLPERRLECERIEKQVDIF